LQHKKSKSLTNKLKELFFPSQSSNEAVNMNKSPWEEKEGVKWVYFKERSEDIIHTDENSEEDLTPKNYAEYIIKKKEEDPSTKKVLLNGSMLDALPDETSTFSVSEFAREFGHRGYGNEPTKKTKEFKVDNKENKIESEKALKKYIALLEEDPYNIEARKKLINLYMERNEYSYVLRESQNLVYRLPDFIEGPVFSGDINYIPPFYIFQFLANTKQSGKISFYLAGEEASVFFLQGKAVHAEDMWGKGEEVVKRVLSWREGHFHFIPNNIAIELSINKPIEKILVQVVGYPFKTEQFTEVKHKK
jgi:hypothetical protein